MKRVTGDDAAVFTPAEVPTLAIARGTTIIRQKPAANAAMSERSALVVLRSGASISLALGLGVEAFGDGVRGAANRIGDARYQSRL